MTRFADWQPEGVIPAVLLPFCNDFSIDEAAYRRHLRDVAAVDGISALTVNGHSSEVHACTPDEQREVLRITMDEIGDRQPRSGAPRPPGRGRRCRGAARVPAAKHEHGRAVAA